MLPKTAKDTKDSQSRLDFFLMEQSKPIHDNSDSEQLAALGELDVLFDHSRICHVIFIVVLKQ